MKISLLSTGIGAIICLAVGFGAGRISSPTTTSAPAALESSPTTVRSSPSSLSLDKSSAPFSHFTADDLEQILYNELDKKLTDQNPAVVQLAITEWSKKDPKAALAYIIENDRKEWLYHSLVVYGRNDTDAALAWISNNTTDLALQNQLTAAVYKGLAKDNPIAAIERAETLQLGPQRNQVFYTVIGQWAESDIDEVFNWIQTQEITPLLSNLYGQTMYRYVRQSPEKAINLISEMEDNINKQNFANQAAFELAKQEPEKALDWAKTLNKEAQHSALMGLMESWGERSDSPEALTYVTELQPSKETAELFSMVTLKMANSSPDTLAEKISTLSEGQQKVAATQLAQVYSANNPEKVRAWLDSLDPGIVRDRALNVSLDTLRHTNIEQAFELSTTFEDTGFLQSEIQQVLLEWVPVDPDAAMAALEATTVISESEKQAIRQNIDAQAPPPLDFLLPAKE